MELVKVNEDKMLLEEKELFYLWDIVYNLYNNHKTKVQSWDTKYKKGGNKEKYYRKPSS